MTDAFWAPRIETNRTVTIPFIFNKNEETGRIANFAIAGRSEERANTRASAITTRTFTRRSKARLFAPDASRPGARQAAGRRDRENRRGPGARRLPVHGPHDRPGPSPAGHRRPRLVEETVSHELYNAGHLYEAAVAHFQATGKRTLLDVALKNADLVADTFGADKRHGFPGHQEIEIGPRQALSPDRERKYLDLARYFLDQRGRDVKLTVYPPGSGSPSTTTPVQIQAHRPVLEQDEAVGHAVRAAICLRA